MPQEGISARMYAKLFSAIARYKKRHPPRESGHTVYAALFSGKTVLVRSSSAKTSPVSEPYGYPSHTAGLHTEVAVCGVASRGGKVPSGPMLVVRENTMGLAMAKPCAACQRYLAINLPRLSVYYSGRDGGIYYL